MIVVFFCRLDYTVTRDTYKRHTIAYEYIRVKICYMFFFLTLQQILQDWLYVNFLYKDMLALSIHPHDNDARD